MKKKWLKSVAFVMSGVLMLGCLSGCGNDTTKDEQGRTIITVGDYPSTNDTRKKNFDEKIAKFTEQNPDAVVYGDEWKFDIKSFYTKAAGGQLPNVYNTNFTEIPQIMDTGYSADITDVLKKRGYDGKFNKDILDVVSKDGRTYAFPFAAYVLGLGYNTEMFEAAGLMGEDGTPMQPKTWEEVREFAVKIKEATGKPGIVFPTSGNGGGWMFSCLAWSFGVDFMEKDPDGKWKATFDSPEAAEALQYIKDLRWKYDVLPANTLVDLTEYYKTYAVGNAGMLMATSDLASFVVQYGMQPEQIGIMAIPAGPKRHVTLLGGGLYGFNQNSTEDQLDAALRWLEMSYNYNATEEFKTNKMKQIDERLEKNQLIGIKTMSVWDSNTESVQFEYDYIDSKANANPNHVRLYNEFIMNCPADIQPEEPVCCQELYSVLDGCLQEVLSNKDADCSEVLRKANADFQLNYLDNIDY